MIVKIDCFHKKVILKEIIVSYNAYRALLAELVDARDSKSRSFGSACSTQAWGTISK